MSTWSMATAGTMTVQGRSALTAAVASRAMAKNWTRERTEEVYAAAEDLVVAKSLPMVDAHGLAECILAADFNTRHGGQSVPPSQGTALWGDQE